MIHSVEPLHLFSAVLALVRQCNLQVNSQRRSIGFSWQEVETAASLGVGFLP